MKQEEKIKLLQEFDFSEEEIERISKTGNLDNVVNQLKQWKKKMKPGTTADDEPDAYSEEYQTWKSNVLGDNPGHLGTGINR